MIPIFFWILLVLYVLNVFVPQTAPYRGRIDVVLTAILFLLVGLTIYHNPLR